MEFITAAVLVNSGQPLKILNDLKLPKLRSGQVLVKIHFAGLCHSQLMEARGHRGNDKYLPHLLGHEGVGTVIDLGPSVTKIKKGDEVILGWIKGHGLNELGTKLHSNSLGEINSGPVTTFSSYSIVSENRVYKKPKNTPPKESVLYGCALPTGAGIILNELKPKENSDIVVIGLGGIGLSALMAAKHKKPRSLIAIDIESEKLDLAKKMGATHALNANEPALEKKVAEICKRDGADYVVEAAGNASTIELGMCLLEPTAGELIFASHPKKGEKICIDPFELICGKKIRGSWGGKSFPDQDIPILDKMHEDGILDLSNLISKEYKLEEINNAFNDLENRKITRGLILMPE